MSLLCNISLLNHCSVVYLRLYPSGKRDPSDVFEALCRPGLLHNIAKKVGKSYQTHVSLNRQV